MRTVSALEKRFDWTWRGAGTGIELDKEVEFYAGRKWRFDFADRAGLVAIEIEGGTWLKGGGGHQRGAGFEKDLEKYFAATSLLWSVFRLGPKMINIRNCQAIGRVIHWRRRMALKDSSADDLLRLSSILHKIDARIEEGAQ